MLSRARRADNWTAAGLDTLAPRYALAVQDAPDMRPGHARPPSHHGERSGVAHAALALAAVLDAAIRPCPRRSAWPRGVARRPAAARSPRYAAPSGRQVSRATTLWCRHAAAATAGRGLR
jgi:hypothetical protein